MKTYLLATDKFPISVCTPKLKDEERLLKKLSGGNELAFTCIFDHYSSLIYSVALKMLKSPNQAEEVVQDVFLKIWVTRENMTNISNFEGYLFMMARNNIYDRFKKSACEKETRHAYRRNRTNTIDNTDHSVIEQQNYKILKHTLNMLPPRQKQIYHLSRDKGMSYKQIGKQLDISQLTVKKHMAEALKFIRQQLEAHLESVILLTVLLEIFR